VISVILVIYLSIQLQTTADANFISLLTSNETLLFLPFSVLLLVAAFSLQSDIILVSVKRSKTAMYFYRLPVFFLVRSFCYW